MSTTRKVAERIVAESWGNSSRGVELLIDAIDKALQAERENAAKITETIPETKFDLDHEPALTESQIRRSIVAAIREGKPQEMSEKERDATE